MSSVLQTQLDLIDWFATDQAEDWSVWFTQASSVAGKKVRVSPSEGLAWVVSELLNQSETVHVSKEMCAVIQHAAETMPDVPLQYEQLFWKRAFIWFDTPINLGVKANKDATEALRTRALLVSHRSQIGDVDDNDRLKPGVDHLTFVDTTDYTDETGTTVEDVGTPLFPYDMSAWVFGKRWQTVPQGQAEGGFKVDEGLAQQRKVLLATLLISQQYVALVSGRKAPRPERRRAGRVLTSPNYGEITHVTLRRSSEANGEAGTDGFEYSHRFMVSGHWRHQFYPSKGRHELIWIDPYVKGPEDKPLIIKDRVYKLVR